MLFFYLFHFCRVFHSLGRQVASWFLQVALCSYEKRFHTAYGFWDGAEDHFDHSRDSVVDFRDNLEPVFDLNGTYATNAYVDVSKT